MASGTTRSAPNHDTPTDDAPYFRAGPNVSAHFPYAAQNWSELWKSKTGQQIDGVIGVDLVTLDRLLSVTGPVTLPDGFQITEQNAVDELTVKGYARYPDVAQRKAYFQTISRAIVDAVLDVGVQKPRPLLTVLADAAGDRHLQLWSRFADEQAGLETEPIAGSVATTTRPYALLSMNNYPGGKLDTFIRRRLTYTGGDCLVDGTRRTTVTATLTNTAPTSGLPDYVTTRLDRTATYDPPVGAERLLAGLYSTQGSLVEEVTVDGEPVQFISGTERGHPVTIVDVDIPPGGGQRTIEWHLIEPQTDKAPLVPVQPMTTPQKTTVDVPSSG